MMGCWLLAVGCWLLALGQPLDGCSMCSTCQTVGAPAKRVVAHCSAAAHVVNGPCIRFVNSSTAKYSGAVGTPTSLQTAGRHRGALSAGRTASIQPAGTEWVPARGRALKSKCAGCAG